MKDFFEVAAQLLMTQASRHGRFCQGRLMRPDEVDRATGGGAPAPGLLKGWHLCGDLHPVMFEAATRLPLHFLGRAYEGPRGVTFLVLAQQVENWQHRFVLPLVGPEAQEYVDYLQTEPFRFSLANGDHHVTLVQAGPAHLRSVVPVGIPVQPMPENVLGLAADSALVAVQALAPEMVTEDGLSPVENVCVSLVHTPTVQAALLSLVARARGELN